MRIAGRFVIDAEVGRGGMGTVYRARDEQTDTVVAIKIVRESSERFDREADLLARLTHPGIVRHIAHGRTDTGEQFLAMQWLEGEDLQRRLARGPLSAGETIELARVVAAALGEVHARGIVHRDVKPSNIWLVDGRCDRAMLLDFGIARPAESWRLTVTGHIIGTPQYMAPEQIQTPRDVDARVDVYALGAVVFECIAGRPPFVGDNAIAVLAKVLIEEAPPLRDLVPDVSRVLSDVVQRSLSKRREGRPADARVLASELANLVTADLPSVTPAPQKRGKIGTAERRLVCVVLAEAGGADVTATPAQMSEELVRTQAIGKMHGMDVVPLAGGYVAMSSSSGVATDHARRAARYALALAAELPSNAVALAMGWGSVSVGPIPVGEAIDRAAGLLRPGRAPGGGVRVDDLTAGLLELACDLAHDANGHILLGERRGTERPRTLLGRSTTCVGRDRDLRALEDLFAEVCEEQVARAALVTAPAGAGKSRIRHELLGRFARSEPPPTIAIAYSEMLRAGSPLDLLARCVRSLVGVDPGDADVQAAIREHVRARIPAASANLAEFLFELAGVPLPAGANSAIDAARADARTMGDQLMHAWLTLISAHTTAAPCVLVLEDLHWGDPQTVRFLDAALRELENAPLFVLALARTDIHDRFPGLWRDRPLQEIRLGALAPRACARLVKEVLPEITEAALGKIIEHSEGNAFFLEELIRASAAGEAPAPTSVVAMVQARLDALDAPTRRVVRAASVFGEACRLAGVAAVLGTVPDDALATVFAQLVAAEVISRRADVENTEYTFRHALVREAAYAMLTDEDRRAAHGVAARWLESESERDALLLAGHYDAAGERGDAARCWADAAHQALEKNDFDAALVRAARALALEPADEIRRHALIAQGRSCACLGRFIEAQRDLEAALVMITDPVRRIEVLRDLFRVAVFRQDVPFIRRTGDEALAIATDLGRPELVAEATAALATADHGDGKVDVAAARFLQACETCERPTLVHGMAGIILYHCARFDEALRWNQRLLSQAIDARDGQGIATTQANVGLSYSGKGLYAEAEESFAKAREVAERHGLTSMVARSISISTGWHLDLYDYDGARQSAEEARHVGRALEFSTPRISALLDLVTIAVRQDRPDEAEQMLDSIATPIANGGGFHGWLWRLRDRILRSEIAAARRAWSLAAELAASTAASSDEYPRIKYAVAARVVQAIALGALDRTEEALTVLARARADAERCGERTWQLRVHLAALGCGDRSALTPATQIAGDLERVLSAPRAAIFRASRELSILGG